MGSNSSKLADQILAEISNIDENFCILDSDVTHSNLSNYSDIDVITSSNPIILMKKIKRNPDFKAYLIMVWEYDEDCYSTFWLGENFENYVQIDITSGSGTRTKYGLNSQEITNCGILGVKFRVLKYECFQVYRAIKDWRKTGLSPLSILENHKDLTKRVISRKVLNEIYESPLSIQRLLDFSRCKLASGKRLLRRVKLRPGFDWVMSDDVDVEILSHFLPRVVIWPFKRGRCMVRMVTSFMPILILFNKDSRFESSFLDQAISRDEELRRILS